MHALTKERPCVSVVIPAYNREAVIGRAIDSVLSQSYQDFEIIVVDDASTDSTVTIVESYSDSRIRCMRHKENRFAGAARNTGITAATGEYIAFLDSDDEWLPEKLELQVNVLESRDESWGCLYSGARIFKLGYNPVDYRASREGSLVKDLLMSKFVIWTPTFIFRRQCLERVGLFDESLIRAQDRDFYIRMLGTYKIASVSEPTVNIYLDTDKGLADVAARSREQLLRKHNALLDDLGVLTKRRTHAIQWFMQSEQYLTEGKFYEALSYLVRALMNFPIVPPRRVGAWVFKLGKALRRKHFSSNENL